MNATITSVGGRAPPGEKRRRISFNRRSSRTSCPSALIRSASAVVTPGFAPWSMPARFTQQRTDS